MYKTKQKHFQVF